MDQGMSCHDVMRDPLNVKGLTLISGCGQYFVYNVAFTALIGAGTCTKTVLKKLAADCFIHTPFMWLPVNLSMYETFKNGSLRRVPERWRNEVLPTMTVYLMVWPGVPQNEKRDNIIYIYCDSGFRVDGTNPKMSLHGDLYKPPFGDCAIYSQSTVCLFVRVAVMLAIYLLYTDLLLDLLRCYQYTLSLQRPFFSAFLFWA